eukprot:TRINITY_DN1739_c0_g1_i3.p1 TRINITY_DN1739_c0_g1~~TRINITY_DN1739_c0_g1_i3.p1  ORF type:complete len:525 (-),score=98.18 TRINITY_DN1739_c0_g1_i3:1001-2575(-)
MGACGCSQGFARLSAAASGEATLLTPPPSPSREKADAFSPLAIEKIQGTVPPDMCCRAQGSGAPPGDCRAALKGDLLLLGCKDTGSVLFARLMAGARVSVQGDTVSVCWNNFPTLTMRIWCKAQAERWGWELKAASHWATERDAMYAETMSSAHVASQTSLRPTNRKQLQLREPVFEDQASSGNLTCSDESVFSQSISDNEMEEADCWFLEDAPSDTELMLAQPMEQCRLPSSSSAPSSPSKPRRRPPLPPKSPTRRRAAQDCQEASDESSEHADASSWNDADQGVEFPEYGDALMKELEWTQAELAKKSALVEAKSALAEAEQQKAASMQAELERLCGLVTKQREKAEKLLANRPKPKLHACMDEHNLLPTVQQTKARQACDVAPTVRELETQTDSEPSLTLQHADAQQGSGLLPADRKPDDQNHYDLPSTIQQPETQQVCDFAGSVHEIETQQHHEFASGVQPLETQKDHNLGPGVQELEAQRDHELPPTASSATGSSARPGLAASSWNLSKTGTRYQQSTS